jgi:hypothetical protein
MGGIAVIWVIDSFVGFYLTLPLRRQVLPNPGYNAGNRHGKSAGMAAAIN